VCMTAGQLFEKYLHANGNRIITHNLKMNNLQTCRFLSYVRTMCSVVFFTDKILNKKTKTNTKASSYILKK